MATILDSIVTYARVTSEYGPDFVINRPFSPSPPSEGDSATTKFLRRAKPRIEIGIQGGEPIVMTPYGKPGPSKWGNIVLVGGIGLGLLVALSAVGAREVIRGNKKGKLNGLTGHSSRADRRSKRSARSKARLARRRARRRSLDWNG